MALFSAPDETFKIFWSKIEHPSVYCPPVSVIHLPQRCSLSTSLSDASPAAVFTVHLFQRYISSISPAAVSTVHQPQWHISSSSVYCPPVSVFHLQQQCSLSTSLIDASPAELQRPLSTSISDTSPAAVSTVHKSQWCISSNRVLCKQLSLIHL